jgi:calcineurin-like phosphoesterase family protein
MNNIFFTSDEHHGHRNILTGWDGEVKPRPWSTLEDMTEGIIDRHNSVVKPGDLVYHLGDMFWRTFTHEAAQRVMLRLNGQHFYIFGNHDELFEGLNGERLCSHFIWCRERTRIEWKPDPAKRTKQYIVLDHFAGRVWDKSHSGSWQLYGHSHGALPELDNLRSFDVGLDAPGNDYTPVSIDTVAARMALKQAPERYNQQGNQ